MRAKIDKHVRFVTKLFSIKKYFLFAGLFYVVLLAYNMGRAFFRPTEALNSGPFDHTVLMWLYEASPHTPWWGFTNWSNYPVGEQIWNPIHLIGQTFYVPFWVFAKLIGPIGAYNILIAVGTLSTALITFLFVRWLLQGKSFWVPLFAGYAVAFTPYVLIKSMVHPSYAFGGIIVALIWALIAYIKKPGTKVAAFIGVISGVVLYTDIYFILYLIITLLAGLLAVVILKSKHQLVVPNRQLFSHILLVISILIVFITPLIFTKLTSSHKIEETLTDARSQKWEEAYAYGARPWEYVLPSPFNPLTPERLRNFQASHLHGSAFRENNLYLGVTLVILALIWVLTFVKRRTVVSKLQKQATVLLAVIFILAILFSMTPKLEIKGLTLYFPSYFVTAITGYFRVLARLVLVAQIALGILAAFGLHTLLNSKKIKMDKVRSAAVVTLAFTLLFVDFMIFKPINRYVWTQNDIPSVYKQVKEDSSVHSIAEYPMIDPPRNFHFIYYATYQMYHRKPIVDAIIIAGNQNETFRESIMNVQTGWQTLRVLRSMNVTHFVIHDKIDPGPIPGAVNVSSAYDIAAENTAWLYKIVTPGDLACVVVPSEGFDGASAYDYKANVQYYMHTQGKIDLQQIHGSDKSCRGKVNLKLEYYTFERQTRVFEIYQDNKLIYSGLSAGYETRQLLDLQIDAGRPIEIRPLNPSRDFSFVVSNMVAQ